MSYSDGVGRLEDIIARNRGQRLRDEASRVPSENKGKMIASLFIGFAILVILALAVFTDLGKPPTTDVKAAPPSRDHHVDDIKIWRQPAKH